MNGTEDAPLFLGASASRLPKRVVWSRLLCFHVNQRERINELTETRHEIASAK